MNFCDTLGRYSKFKMQPRAFIFALVFQLITLAAFAQPSITSFAPTSGSIGTTVTITGTNFNTTPANNIVYFGATKSTVTAATATQLTVIVPAGATSIAPISVQDITTGLQASSLTNMVGSGVTKLRQFTVTTTIPFTPNYVASSTYTFGNATVKIVTGDFDGINGVDIATVDFFNNNVFILLNNGNGSFTLGTSVNVGTNPFAIAVADFNSDGKMDLAVEHMNGGVNIAVSIRLGNGNGTFYSPATPEVPSGISNYAQGEIVTGDFNGDGKIDFATHDYGPGSLVSIRLGDGLGGFSATADVSAGANTYPYSLAVGDFNGDGKADLATANINAVSVSIRLGDGNAGFTGTTTVPVGSGPDHIQIGDFNGDGKLDFATSDVNDHTISIKLGDGSGNFSSGSLLAVVDANSRLALGDFNGDGKTDIVTGNLTLSGLRMFLGDGSGGVTVGPDISSGGFVDVTVGDFNGDGKADLAAITNGNTVKVFSSNNSIKFNGVNQEAQLGTWFNYQNFTVSMWVKPGSTQATYADIIDNNHNGGRSWVFQQDANNLNQYGFFVCPTVTLQANVWQHIALVSQGAGVYSVYVDGCLKSQKTAGPLTINYDGTESLRLANWGGGGRNWNGEMDEVKIYNRALSEAEIKADVYSPVPPSTPNLVAYYKMNEAGGSIAFDATVNSRHANLINSPTFQLTGVPAAGLPAPTISSFSPTSGLVGSTVTITGTNFSTVPSENIVSFNFTLGTVTASTATSITTTVPAGATTGKISVTIGCNTVTSSSNFTVNGVITPSITNFTPSSGPIGTTVTINGANFSATPANNIVYFGATKATVTAATSTQLTVNVPVGATYQPISLTIAGQTVSSSNPFIVTFPNGGIIDACSFTVPLSLGTGGFASGVNLGDLDGDGKTDVVITDAGTSMVRIFRNTSTIGIINASSFAASVDLGVGTNPFFGAVEDIDGDGKLDIVIAGYASDIISIYRNTSTVGALSFGPRLDLTTGSAPYNVSCKDLDGDGKTDIVVSNAAAGTISIWQNIGVPGAITAGSFNTRFDIPGPSTGLAIADIDADGKPDLIAGYNLGSFIGVSRNISNSGTLSAGSFAAFVNFAVAAWPEYIVVGDLDADNRPDIVTSSWPGNKISILKNTSTQGTIDASSLAASVDINGNGEPRGITITDFDGDGLPDIGLSNQTSNVSIYKNANTPGSITSASFLPKVNFTGTGNARGIKSGDIDGDGKPDLLVASWSNPSLVVLRNTVAALHTISTITPASGSLGTIVTITGTNFNTTPSENTVTFNGVSATVTASTTTTITTIVPGGATTGPISVQIGCKTVNSSSFAVTPYAPFGNTVLLNGTTDYVNIADDVALHPANLTMEAWVNFTTPLSFSEAIFAKALGAGDNNSFAMWLWGGTLNGLVNNTANQNSPVGLFWTPVLGQWYHLAYTFDNTSKQQKLYIDGFNVATNTAVASPDYDNKATLIGADINSGSYGLFARGRIDEARIWNVARTPSEILSTINNTLVGNEPGLVSYYKMDEVCQGAGITVQNSSALTGSILNGTTIGTPSTPIFTIPVTPTVTSFAPTSGSVGTTVIITGTNFDPILANNSVKFNGIAAAVTASTATTITTTVPAGATTGTVSVQVGCNSATSSGNFTVVAAVPVITNFSPASGPIGTNVTINGTNFSATPTNNIVYFGATKATVTAATGTQLTVTVPVGATYQPITVQVSGLTVFSSKPFLVTFPGGGSIDACSFAPAINFGTITGPSNAVRGELVDIDGDGKTDILIADRGANVLSIYRNTSTAGTINAGSFAPKINFTTTTGPLNTANGPVSVASGELDGDALPDIVISHYNTGTLSVFKNQSTSGNISLAAKVDFTIPSFAWETKIYDIDGDGKSEIVVTSFSGLTIFKNTSTQGIIDINSFAAGVNFSGGANPAQFSIADFDGDSKPDIIVPDANSYSATLLRNTSTLVAIAFAAPSTLTSGSGVPPVGLGAVFTATGDIDNDNKLDVVVGNYTLGTFAVFKNNSTPGSFSFAPRVDFNSVGIAGSINLSDLDGDGKLDLSGFGNNSFSLLKNTATTGVINSSSFSALVSIPPVATNFVVGDIDGDGKSDLITSNPTISVLQNVIGSISSPTITSLSPSSGSIGTSVTITGTNFSTPFSNSVTLNGVPATITGSTATSLTIAVPAGATSGPLNVTIGCNTVNAGNFTVGVITPTLTNFTPSSGPIGTTVTITGTNFSTTPANNIVYFGATKTTVTAATTTQLTVTAPTGATYQPITVQVAGLTAYSSKRFFPTFPGGGSLDVCSFARKDFAAGLNPLGMMIKDFDGDGKGDIAITEVSSYQLSIYKNTSTIGVIDASTLSTPVSLATLPINPWSVSSGDIDGDGKPDLVVANSLGSSISIYRNTSTPGNISFDTKVDFASGVAPWRTVVIDIDGDGKPEIVVSNRFSNSVSVFKNTSSTGSFSASTFAAPVSFSTGTEPFDVSVGDLNGDDKPDIVALNNASNTVSVFQNTATSGVINSSSFSAKVDFPLGGTPYGLALADIDGDAKLDILATNSYANSTISILQNVSGGTINASSFSPKVDFSVGLTPAHFGLADFNGDGKLDLAISNSASNTLTLLRNTSTVGSITSASLAAGINIAALLNPAGIAAGDIDGDGRPEIVVGNFLSGSLSIYQNLVGLINPPTIVSFTPSGAIGSSVTITGTNFSTPFSNTVSFNGVPASITASTATTITVTVPVGATTGPLTVIIGCNTVMSATNFTIATPQNFITQWNLATAGSGPTQLSFGTATSGSVNYTWQEISPGTASGSGSWSGASLTITGLPVGATIRLQIGATNFQRININNGLDRNRLTQVEQWGSTTWTSMQRAFLGCSNLQVVATDVPNLSGVVDMSLMFYNCTNLNSPGNINTWNTSAVTDMSYMFQNASAFNQNIGSWNTAAVTNMTYMFGSANAFNQNIGAWNTAAVTNMNSMFYQASAFNQNIGPWNTAAVTNMKDMFYAAATFNQDISAWNTAAVTNMRGMFTDASSFNQNIAGWNTGAVTSMRGMFDQASAFNQNIGAWNLNSGVDLAIMLNGSGMDCNNYSATLIGWNANSLTPLNRTLGATGRQYGTNAAAPRTNLTGTMGWTITGDAPSGTDCTLSTLPTITSFTPTNGSIGTTVSINGTNFSTTPTTNIVKFNGTTAIVTASTATSITTTVPTGATTGLISVTVGTSTGVSATNFTVTASPVISITTQPSDFIACIGQTATYTTAAIGTTNIAYQWQFSPNGSPLVFTDIVNGANYSGATTTTLSVNTTANFGLGRYRCRINGDFASEVITNDEGLFINPISTAPTVVGANRCGAGSVTLTASGGTNGQYKWYTVAVGGTAISGEVNDTYTTPSISSNTSYFVSLNVNGCESSRTAVTAIINLIPPVPTTPVSASSCGASILTVSVAGGTNGQYRWYTIATGGTALTGEVNSSYTTPAISATTTYYVSINDGTCESFRTSVIATINTPPSAPTTTGGSSCGTGVVTLTASGGLNGQYRWYTASTGGTPIVGQVNSTFTTPSLSTSTTYFVSIDNGTCESARKSVFATINTIPPAPTTIGANSCGSGTIVLNASGGINGQYRWYGVATGGTPISGQTNSTFTTPSLSTTTTYFVSIDNGSCESTRTPVTATINITSAPATTGASGCPASLVTLSASGGTNGQYKWYTVATGGTAITGATNNTYQIPSLIVTSTFYVSLTISGCESTRTPVTATLLTTSCAPVITTQTLNTQVEGKIEINLQSLITTPGTLDPTSIKIVIQPASGAIASITNFVLTIDYKGKAFSGKESVTIEACNTNGLCSQQVFTIEVAGEVIVFNAVSPNGDGKNEFLVLQYIESISPKNQVSIYNRWGDEVFSISDYDNKTRVFSGLANGGGKLPGGTYFYKVNLMDAGKTLTGFVLVKN